MTTGASCQHHRCPLPPWRGTEWCILHDPDPSKDAAEFQGVLDQKLKKDEKQDPNVKVMNLSGVHFPAPVEWHGWEFPKAVSFAGAHFHQGAFFWDAQFHQEADFGYAQFHGEASFGGARFHQRAFFGYAQFHQEASFRYAQFRGETDFRGTRFSPATRTDFSDCTVSGRLAFRQAAFPNEEQYVLWVLVVLPWLMRCLLAPSPAPGQGIGRVVFHDMVIEKDADVLFEGVDLSRVSFLRTDLGRVRFRDVKWARREERLWRILWKIPRQVLHDHLEKGEPHLVGELYRQLRLNLEPARQEIEAGDFYIGQMDMRRQDRKEFSPGYRVLLGFYRFAALYGESWQRPLGLYLLLGLAFAFAYLLAGFEGIGSPIHYRLALGLPALGDFAQALAHALSAGGIFQQDLRLLSPWAPLARYANAVADIFLLAVAVVALRRRFRR